MLKSTLKNIGYSLVLILMLRAGCSGPLSPQTQAFIDETDAYSEKVLTGISISGSCVEEIITENFPKFRMNRDFGTDIIYAFEIGDKTNETVSADWYLVEVITIDFSKKNSVRIQVRFFDSIEGRIRKLKRTTNKRESIINELSDLIKNCPYGV